MRSHISKLALSLIVAGACGGSTKHDTAKPQAAAASQPARAGLQIKLVTVYVDDQDKALRFYTNVMGFAKKDDFTNGPYRWLTVTDAGGTELQLALNDNAAAKAYQHALFQQKQPAIMFYTDDVKADYERIKSRGGDFTMPPTDVTASTIATLQDTCGNFVQLTQLNR